MSSFYNSVVLPIFDYANRDKNNATIMNDLQHKVAKILLDRPFYSSATDAVS